MLSDVSVVPPGQSVRGVYINDGPTSRVYFNDGFYELPTDFILQVRAVKEEAQKAPKEAQPESGDASSAAPPETAPSPQKPADSPKPAGPSKRTPRSDGRSWDDIEEERKKAERAKTRAEAKAKRDAEKAAKAKKEPAKKRSSRK